MAVKRKKSLYDAKTADVCPCGCCKWHSSKAVRYVLASMFVLIVIAGLASIIYSSNPYYSQSILSFMGVIFLIIFIGWGFGFFCSCRGVHWSRHGYALFDEPKMIAKRRYAEGKISKGEYEKVMRSLH